MTTKPQNEAELVSGEDLSEGQMKRLLQASGKYSWEPELNRVLGKMRVEAPEGGEIVQPSTVDDVRKPPTKLEKKSTYQPPPARLDALHVARGLATIGPYRVKRELGRGAMGVVLLAHDDKLHRDVAIKVLRSDRDNSTNRQRFVREARAAARLTHENVVAVHAVDEPEHGLPYIVMNYVDGCSLAQRIAKHGPLPGKQAAEVARQVATGLHAAHQQGLVHRDVKPGNILIERASGSAKISDFGLVRVHEGERFTREEVIPGTPEYMSPDQFDKPNEVDARTDVYSLGVTLYEMLTGETPFRGQPHMIVNQILKDDPVPPRLLNDAVPVDLQTVCLKAMSKDPKRRYASCQELAEDLTRWLAGEPVKARPVGRVERMTTWVKRHRSVVALTTLVFVVSVVSFCAVVHQWWRAEQNLLRFRNQVAVTEHATNEANREKFAAQQARSQVIAAVVSQQLLRNPSPSRKEITQQIVHSMMGTFESSLRDYEGDPQKRPELAGAHLAVGWAAWNLEEHDKALKHYGLAKDIYIDLAKESPSEATYQQHLGTCWQNMGELHKELGDESDASQALQNAMTIRTALVDTTPQKQALHYRLDLVVTRISLADSMAESRKEAALVLLQQASAELISFINNDEITNDPQFRWRRAEACGKLGDAWVAVKNPHHAIVAYEYAAAGHHTSPGEMEAAASWYAKAASLWDRLGEKDKARTRWVKAMSFQRRVVHSLPDDPDLKANMQRYQQQVRRHGTFRLQSDVAVDRVRAVEVKPAQPR